MHVFPARRAALALCGAALASALSALPGASAAEPPEGVSDDELKQLEASLGADADETPTPPTAPLSLAAAVQSMNPHISLILDVALAYFHGKPRQAGAHDPNKTGFTFQQLELHMDAAVDPYFKLDANIVFSQFGVEVEEAYATSLAIPWGFQVRLGQFLTRFGRLNPTHPHTWSFADQTLVHGKFFGGEGNRGIGLELSWLAPTPWYLELVASGTQADGECCARSYFGGDNSAIRGPQDFLYTLAIKQFFAFDSSWSLFWGLTAQLGPNATGQDNRSEIYGTDLYLRWRPTDSTERMAFSLQAEGMFRSRQVPGEVLQDWGLYAQAVWQITPEWEVGARYDFVTGQANDDLDPDWTRDRSRASLQVTLYPSHFSRLRVQGSYDAPGWREDPIWAAILSAELLIGAHGSHTF